MKAQPSNLLRVKLSIPGAPANLSLDEFGGRGNILDGVHIGVNDGSQEADLWFVSDNALVEGETCLVNPRNVFWFSEECAYPMDFYNEPSRLNFLRQFARVFTCYDIDLPNVIKSPVFGSWFINANHGYSSYPENKRDHGYFSRELFLEKPFDLSVICSNKTFTPDHAARFDFVSRLKGVLGDRLHWFGNGINPIPDKFPGIAPYRYHLAIENKHELDVFTEKIFDPFLCLAFPIYSGAPNIGDYFPVDSFKVVDIGNFDEAVAIIVETIASDLCVRNREALLEARRRVLNERGCFHRYAKIAKDYYQEGMKETVTISRCRGGYT